MDKIYVIEELDCDVREYNSVIGYCETEEEAKKCCEKLTKESNKNMQQWNDHCANCLCECEAFKTATDENALNELEKIRNSGCPYAKDAEIKEIFYGKDNKSGGFEITCDHMVHDLSRYCYIAIECKKIEA